MKPSLRGAHRAIRSLLAASLMLTALTVGASGCAVVHASIPACRSLTRIGLIAQSVPTAAYVPCVSQLPPGWSVPTFEVDRGATRFSLLSDRSPRRPVEIRLTSRCDIGGAEPSSSRAPGVQTYVHLASIDPRYAGTLFDVFPGGCITYRFDFQRGVHITLMQEFEGAVTLLSRHYLRSELHNKLGLQLEP